MRLAFAIQVQLEPDILIVDEALAVGDALFRKRCYQRLQSFLRNRSNLLFVSHDQEAVRTLTSRSILLDGGHCRAIGPSSEIVLEYCRRLHEEEIRHAATHSVASSAAPAANVPSLAAELAVVKTSYGDFEAYIKRVELFVSAEPSLGAVRAAEEIRISVTYHFVKPLTQLSFCIRLGNKEGVKVYSGSTLATDILDLQEHQASKRGMAQGLRGRRVRRCRHAFQMPARGRLLRGPSFCVRRSDVHSRRSTDAPLEGRGCLLYRCNGSIDSLVWRCL